MKIIKVYDKDDNCYDIKVDDADYPELIKYNWVWRDGYAAIRRGRTYYQMHRFIMGVVYKEPVLVDHEDNDHTNNQRYNLRRADRFQNQQNRKTNKDNSLPKGVQQLPSGNFRVRVQGWNERVTVGTYPTLEQAIEARNDYAKEVHKEFYNPSHLV